MAGPDFQYDNITLTYSPYDLGTMGATDFDFGRKLLAIVLNFIFDLILQTNFVKFASSILSVCFESMDGHMVTSIFSLPKVLIVTPCPKETTK